MRLSVDIHKDFGPFRLDAAFETDSGAVTGLLGASGCGKSVTLKCIAGIETPDEGHIELDGEVLFDSAAHINLSPQRRRVGYLFQNYALFPNMTVEQNIAAGVRDRAGRKETAARLMRAFYLEGNEHKYPRQLSGGQQQRVAIARAIVNEPKVLLLDEPLGALDLKLRHDMQRELIKIKKEVGITFVYVTHDQEEALTMSDRIIVMNKGIIQQIGTSKSIYDEPQNAFVADFIGDSNIIDGIMRRDCLVEIQGVEIPCVDVGFGKDELVDVVIRPEDLVIVRPEEGYLQGTVVSIIFKGAVYEIKVQAGDYEWMIESVNPAQVGVPVGLTILPDNIQIMHKPHSEDAEVIREDE